MIKKIKDGIDWLIDKIPSIPKPPKFSLPDIPGIGGRDLAPGGVGAIANLSHELWDEAKLAQMRGLGLSSIYRPGVDGDHGGQARERLFG